MSNFPWRLFAGPSALLAVLAIGYPVYWYVAAGWLERGVAAWVDARRGEGWSVEHGEPAVRGFPLALRLTLPKPSLASERAGWRWRGERVTVALQPWNWRRVRIEPAGVQQAAVRVEGTWRRLDIAASRSVFVGRIGGDGALAEAALEIEDLKLVDPGDARLFRARGLRFLLRAPNTGAAAAAGSRSVALRLSEAELTDRFRFPLGRRVERLDIDARLRAGLPRGPDVGAMEAWRQAGGAVEVEALDLRWGQAGLRAAGTVTLDAMMRPAGSLQAELRGYAETVAALDEAGLIRRKDAATIQIALDLLARPGSDGTKSVAFQATARDGRLYLGPLRILKFSALPFWAPSARRTQPGASR